VARPRSEAAAHGNHRARLDRRRSHVGNDEFFFTGKGGAAHNPNRLCLREKENGFAGITGTFKSNNYPRLVGRGRPGINNLGRNDDGLSDFTTHVRPTDDALLGRQMICARLDRVIAE